ncbi:MAG: sulfatase-like hydrolase/transferase [Hydrogenophaga sp.]|uniref:sulfatase-like hydrolase/transferase n=1 Tax=Hydrogenophaga sp. TaxID=1904254 RepID=UPI0027199FAB|nr:sulfatase-like hydrolase/transferase [Hydrogenophaga sp.]MDO9571880.1 sulfatase-like hydrolase/transferase [Hydrogenophaga sp.]MDP3373964.1 sulfatase-like hydrolase/transferase [Hydrogenophaga sp.]
MTMGQPNFIYILADDLGYADLGCCGARDAYSRPTDVSPNLDRMAAQGMRFTRGYANSAVCSPTRFALITGRWQYRLRGAAEEPLGPAYGDKVLGLPPSHPTLPSLLGAAGYRTALMGKWHLGYPPHFGPRQSGYQTYFGYHGGGVDYFAHTGPRGGADLWENETPIEREGYLTDLLSRQAVEFVEAQTPDQPFLLSLHYSAPHWPWLTRDDAEESRHTRELGWHPDGGSVEVYQKMIHHMDEGIGWLLDALEKKGLAQNTLVVFTSDNGGERFSNNWPLCGEKMDLLEGGIRVPLLARWPERIPAGLVSDCPNLTMDWTATLLAAAGVAADADHPLDGVDLLPLFADASWTRPGDLCWRMKHRSQRALIRGDWKYLHQDGHDFLFNLAADARERANVARRYPEKLAELRDAWQAWNASLPPIPDDARVFKLFQPGDVAVPSGAH